MNIKIINNAGVRGWCHAKPYARIEIGPDEKFLITSSRSPYNKQEADCMNAVFKEIVKRCNDN